MYIRGVGGDMLLIYPRWAAGRCPGQSHTKEISTVTTQQYQGNAVAPGASIHICALGTSFGSIPSTIPPIDPIPRLLHLSAPGATALPCYCCVVTVDISLVRDCPRHLPAAQRGYISNMSPPTPLMYIGIVQY